MKPVIDYDVVVVGSGPAGATTARVAAERGLKVLLIDKKQELGAPIQCSGAVSAHALADSGVLPEDEFVSIPIHGFTVYDAHGNATILDYRELKPAEYRNLPLGYVVDRRRFDRYLMSRAERSGVEVWLKTEAYGYTAIPGGLAELHLKRFGQQHSLRTRIIVGADGLQSQVGKWANLKTHIKLSELASCLQFVVDQVKTNELLEIITGHQWAPGGYAWIFPKGHGYTEVGIGVIRTMTERDARWHLEYFMKESFLAERFQKSRVLEVQGGGVPLAAPLRKQYADHIILVGDAARHVNPITGGGIHTALRCGVIAGNFLGDFLASGSLPAARHLAEYQRRWMAELGKTMWRLYRIKRDIFNRQDMQERDALLYRTLADYFSPASEFRKV